MRKPSRADGKAVKARPRKTLKLKGGRERKVQSRRGSSSGDQGIGVAQLTSELKQAREQQTAISKILRVISSSPSDVQPVLDAVAQHAAQMCEAQIVDIAIVDNDVFRTVAWFGDAWRPPTEEALPVDRSAAIGRSIRDLQPVHFADLQNASDEFPLWREFAIKHGFRTVLAVPLIRERRALGAILAGRTEARPFERKHIALLTTFADQAAIAIENVRLFEAEQERARELTESLEQQAATSEVLQVISDSPGDLQHVFTTILEKAVRICDANFGNLSRWDGEAFHLIAAHNTPPAFAELRKRSPSRPSPTLPFGRMLATKTAIHITDLATEDAYVERQVPEIISAVEVGGMRTLLAVPILKEKKLIGAFSVYRQEVRPFTDKQIATLTNFASQAVIAIENARLLNELRQRTDELGHSVEELRGLGEVSQVVNSTLDLEKVLSTIVAKAAQLSGTEAGAIYVADEAQREYRLRATYGMDKELIHALAQRQLSPEEPNIAALIARREPMQVADLAENAASDFNETSLRTSYRARLVAPLIDGDNVIGLLVVRRRAAGAFPRNTVDLIRTFATQSALAIQNARLFYEIERKRKQLEIASQIDSRYLEWLRRLATFLRHEVRQPIAQINSSVELIQLVHGHDDRVKPYLASASLAAQQVWNLVERASRATDAEAFVRQAIPQLIDLNEVLNEIVENYRRTYSGMHVHLVDRIGAWVLADRTLVKEAVENLLTNAASFAKEDSTIQITLELDGRHATIKVSNNGPLLQRDAEVLFRPFASSRSGPSSEHEGLGLYLVRLIAEQHGGTAAIADLDDGSGVQASITLPLTTYGASSQR